MREEVGRELSRVSLLPPGSGSLSAYGFVRGLDGNGLAGGGIDYSHHVRSGLALFGSGELGRQWGERNGLAYKAILGGRMTF